MGNHEVLLIEDNPADARLVLDGCCMRGNLTIVNDGTKAMDYLNKKGIYKDKESPSLIILDLNLPLKDGRDVLKEIKKNEKLKAIPVVVLTTSSNEEDILSSYNHGANVYLNKPLNFDHFEELIRTFEDFWFKWATLPKLR
jgi:chemotaxis family two-component system response regulator Rcp1